MTADNRVVYVEIPGSKPLPEASALRVAAAGAEITCVTDIGSALAVLSSDALPPKALVLNAPEGRLLRLVRDLNPKTSTVLVTELTMERYSRELSGGEDVLIDHVIANRQGGVWTINELRVTLQKILRQDFFGVGKYLAPATPLVSHPVRGSADREPNNTAVMAFAKDHRLGDYMSKLIFGITEELLMNAIYDAPVAGGRTHYAELPRTTPIALEPSEYATLSYGCDGSVFAVAVADPFGALSKPKLYQYLKKILRRSDSANLIDTKKGGAGLGLFKILYSSHALVCNVQPGARTEVISLIDTQQQVRDFSKMPRSIHYFEA